MEELDPEVEKRMIPKIDISPGLIEWVVEEISDYEAGIAINQIVRQAGRIERLRQILTVLEAVKAAQS